MPPQEPPALINKRWQLESHIAYGGCAHIYALRSIHSNRRRALKWLRSDTDHPPRHHPRHSSRHLQNEIQVFKHIQHASLGGHYPDGIPKMYTHGTLKDAGQNRRIFITMDLLGPSLRSLLCDAPGNTFSLRTTLHVGVQLFSRLEWLHARRISHGDVHAANVAVDRTGTVLYLIDFGSAHCFNLDVGRQTRGRSHVSPSLLQRLFRSRLQDIRAAWVTLRNCVSQQSVFGPPSNVAIPQVLLKLREYIEAIQVISRNTYTELKDVLQKGLEDVEDASDGIRFEWTGSLHGN